MHESIIPGADDPRPGSVEAHFVDRMRRHVDRADLRDRAHVPELDHAVGIARSDDVAPGVARHPIARVRVAVKGLDAEPGSDVPERHGLVAGAGGDGIGDDENGASAADRQGI